MGMGLTAGTVSVVAFPIVLIIRQCILSSIAQNYDYDRIDDPHLIKHYPKFIYKTILKINLYAFLISGAAFFIGTFVMALFR